jgi:hypothetical protein
MTDSCEWLPDLVLLEAYGGDWERYLAAVYQYFKQDFIDSRPTFEEKNVGLQREPLFKGKEYSFWHCTSEGEEEEERTPDIRRCERIRWPRPIIEHPTDRLVRCWRNKRKSEKRVLFWFYEEDYLVIIAERKNYFLLRTAYFVTYKHTKEKLMKEYEEYLKKADATS